MKRNFWIAFVAMMLMMVVVFGCVGCSNNNSTQNDNSNVEQTTPDINNNEPNGSENSDQNNGSNDVENNVNNGNETTEPDVNGDVNNGTNDDNNGNTDNNTGNNDNSDNGSTGDDSNTDNNFPTDNLVGLGIYVFPSNETPNYRHGDVIKGVETTLNDGTVMYMFGQFQSLYFIDAIFDDAYDVWGINCRYSSNLVYCGYKLTQRTDGTFYSYMDASYVDTTGRELSYYVGRIYEANGQYAMVVDGTQETFSAGMTTVAETVTFYAGEALVEMEVYIALDVEMFDGLYNAYEFVFYNSSGTVVNTVSFDINNIPSELVWEDNYFRADVRYKYNGETLFEKEIRSNSVYLGQEFVCDTVINGVGYHHNIAWVVDTEN